MTNWLALKLRPTQFASEKNRPGVDYPSKITEANQKPQEKPKENPSEPTPES
jgi:hypothetical protein